jgi:signal transduction histidine kinase
MMASLPGDHGTAGTTLGLARSRTPLAGAGRDQRLWQVHARLGEGAAGRIVPLLATAHARAAKIVASAGGSDAADRLAAATYTSDVIVALAAEGELDAADTRIAAAALADVCNEPFAVAGLDLYLRAVASPTLLELPPVVAAEIQIKLLLHLDVATEASVWRRAGGAQLACVLALGTDSASRSVRAAAKAAATRGGGLSLVSRTNLRSAQVRRFDEPAGAIVIRVYGDPRRDVDAFLQGAATALSPVLERMHLLERNAARENALVAAGEKRLLRLGFDLHDGPVQDVLALKSEVRHLRDQIYPFILESHRDLAAGRFDDMLARLAELDLELRELAHSLETRSIVSRPLSEIVHREVDAFAERSGIEATVDVKGDPDSLSSAQRIAVFRAVQESLANVREHSGATVVEVRLRSRRNTVDMSVTDNGQGFEVSRALAQAAQRGRLGLVGIGERVRMLGGTFEIDSVPGGPTTLRVALPRWEPFTPIGKQGEHGNHGAK